jgi:uncharacterized protein (TIGR03085 family)
MSRPSLARRERHALCDLALAVGPDAPTLCGGWAAADLVAHLLVRERRPIGALGIAVPPLSGLTDKAMAAEKERPFPAMVQRLRKAGLSVYTLPVAEELLNTLEYLVHHEDLRRAQPEWAPRDLSDDDEDTLWRLVKRSGPLLVRKAGVPVVVRRLDRPGKASTIRSGDDPVTITGKPSELALVMFGRDQLRDVVFDGPPESVRRLRGAELGF